MHLAGAQPRRHRQLLAGAPTPLRRLSVEGGWSTAVRVSFGQIVAHQGKQLRKLRPLARVQRTEKGVFDLFLRGRCGVQTLLSIVGDHDQVAAAVVRVTLPRHQPLRLQGVELRDEHAGRRVSGGSKVALR